MTTIDTSKWSMLNMWREADGDLIVRPGLRELFDVAATIVGGFSVKNSYTGETWHYIATDEGAGGIHLHIYDEGFVEWQDFTWAETAVTVRAVTCAVVQGQMLICSPDLPTLYAVVGSGVQYAESIASDNPTTTALTSVPRGIVVAICNRAVIADGRTLYVSDPIGLDGGDLRTFVGQNVNQRPGVVFGMHEGAGGMLVCVTSEGTYGLDADAFAVQVVGMNGTGWRLLSHITAQSFRSTCSHRGRVFALTRDGYAPADVETFDEEKIADPTMPRARGSQIAADFRSCSLFSSNDGPIVACPDAGAFHRSDLQTGTMSWWADQTDDPGNLVGMLRSPDGDDLLLFGEHVYAVTGDYDGAAGVDGNPEALTQPYGTIIGVLRAPAAANMLPRHITHAAAVDGSMQIAVAVRGSEHATTVEHDPFALADGDGWSTDGLRWLTVPMAGVRIDFGDRVDTKATRDVGVELSAQGCGVRVNGMAEVELSQSAAFRPQKVG